MVKNLKRIFTSGLNGLSVLFVGRAESKHFSPTLFPEVVPQNLTDEDRKYDREKVCVSCSAW